MQLWLLNFCYWLLFSFWQISFSFLGTSFCLLYLPCYFLGPASHRTALGIPCKRIYSVTPKKNQSDTFSIVQKEEIPVSFREGSGLDYILNLFQTEWQNWKRTKDILFTSNGNTRKNDWCSSSCHMELQCTQTQIWEFTTMLLWPAFRVGDKLQVNSVDDFIPVSNTTILLLTFKCIPFFSNTVNCAKLNSTVYESQNKDVLCISNEVKLFKYIRTGTSIWAEFLRLSAAVFSFIASLCQTYGLEEVALFGILLLSTRIKTAFLLQTISRLWCLRRDAAFFHLDIQ